MVESLPAIKMSFIHNPLYATRKFILFHILQNIEASVGYEFVTRYRIMITIMFNYKMQKNTLFYSLDPLIM